MVRTYPVKLTYNTVPVVLTVGETGCWMEDVTGCEDNQIMGIFSPPRHKYALRNNFIVSQPPLHHRCGIYILPILVGSVSTL